MAAKCYSIEWNQDRFNSKFKRKWPQQSIRIAWIQEIIDEGLMERNINDGFLQGVCDGRGY